MPVNDPFAQPAVVDPFAVVDPLANEGPIRDIAAGARAIGDSAKAAGDYVMNSKAANVLKKTGNQVLDFISNYDRPRNALAVGTRDAYEAAQLPVDTQAENFRGFRPAINAGGVVDAFLGGVKKGGAQEDFASTQQLLPDDFRKDNPVTSGVAGFVGDVATDPLTYGTLGIAPAVKGIANLVKKVPVENNALLGTFNVHVGDLAKAKDIERKYRDLVAAEKDDIVKGTRAYNNRLQSLADDLGITLEQAKARIVAAAEGGEEAITQLGMEANALVQKNRAQLLKEQELGIPTTERDGYFPHVLTPEGRKAVGKEDARDIFRRNNPAHASTKQRKLEGTVAEINAKRMYGTDKFFYDDPVIAQAVRDVRHAQSVGTAKFLKEVGESLGQAPDKAPGHFVKSKAMPDKVFDPYVAKMVDKVHKQITDPEELANFLKVYDGAQNWWKSWGLAPRPDYHARNVVGNMFLNYLGDVKNPAVYKAAAEIQFKADKGALSNRQRMIYEAARKRGVVNHGQFSTDIPEAVTKTIERETSRIKASDVITPTTDNVLVRGGFAAGKALENNARLAHFIDKVNKGMSYDDAAKSVKKYLFDYDDLSDMERNVFKRVLPFYTWSRRNIPLQIEAMATQPGKINKINIAKNQAHQQNEVPDEEAIPNYIKDAGPIHLGQQDGMNKTATLAGYLPTMDLTKLANPADMGVGMISPFIKEPIEQAFNYDTFRRDKIEKFDGQSNDFLGVKMPARLAKVARSLILLNSIDRANPGGVFGDAESRSYGLDKEVGLGPFAIGTTRETRNDLPGGERTLQFGTGVRLSSIDLEKQQSLYDIATKKDLQQLKAYVRSANRRNKSREAEEALRALEAAIKKAEE